MFISIRFSIILFSWIKIQYGDTSQRYDFKNSLYLCVCDQHNPDYIRWAEGLICTFSLFSISSCQFYQMSGMDVKHVRGSNMKRIRWQGFISATVYLTQSIIHSRAAWWIKAREPNETPHKLIICNGKWCHDVMLNYGDFTQVHHVACSLFAIYFFLNAPAIRPNFNL